MCIQNWVKILFISLNINHTFRFRIRFCECNKQVKTDTFNMIKYKENISNINIEKTRCLHLNIFECISLIEFTCFLIGNEKRKHMKVENSIGKTSSEMVLWLNFVASYVLPFWIKTSMVVLAVFIYGINRLNWYFDAFLVLVSFPSIAVKMLTTQSKFGKLVCQNKINWKRDISNSIDLVKMCRTIWYGINDIIMNMNDSVSISVS